MIALLAALLASPLQSQALDASQSPQAAIAVSADEAELRRLNDAWLNAYPTHDVATLDRLLADDFRTVIAGGGVLAKADLLRSTADPARVITNISWSNVQVFVFGDVALVTGRSTLTGSMSGQDISGVNEYADVYSRRGGRWQAISAFIVRTTPPRAVTR